jgi:tricorn protease
MRANIWAVDLDTGAVRQVTHFADFDIHFPAIGPDDMVFENGGRLYVMDLGTETARPVEVEVMTDRASLRPHVAKVGERITGGDISPSGKRAVLAARGEIFSLPAEHGVVRNLTRTSGVAERSPAWSPDGKTLAYFSDRSGEYELTVRPADGSGGETTLTSMGPGFRYSPMWSPDSKKMVFIDSEQVIRLLDVATKSLTEIDSGMWMTHPPLSAFEVSWSADSRWIAYSRGLDNSQSAVFLYDTSGGARHQVTTGFVESYAPVFDPEGEYLYYLSDRTFAPIYAEMDPTWIYANTTNIVAVPLRADVASPLAPRNDVEDNGEDDEANGNDEAKPDKDAKDEGDEKKIESVKIDLEGFEARAVVLPLAAGQYTDLGAVEGKVIYRRQPRTGGDEDSSPLLFWDLEDREEKTILDDADGYAVSANGKKMLVVANGSFAIVDVGPKQKMDTKLATSSMEMTVVPPEEWRQIFSDAWRLERDFFYDPNMHGVDGQAMRERYGALLDDVITRWDLNFVIGELIAELNTSHSYRGGGDVERADRRGVGLLGVDWELADGAYRIKRIVTAAPWDTEARSPLAEPGVDVSEGDCARGARRDARQRGPAAQPGVDRGQPPQGRPGDRRQGRLCLRAEHRTRRPDRALPDVPSPVRPRRSDHRRALQQRRPDSRPFRRAPRSPALQLLGRALGQGPANADDRSDRTEGDADQRVERFGRRRVSLLLPRCGSRAAHRYPHLGRSDRLLRPAGADRRRAPDGSDLLVLQPGG